MLPEQGVIPEWSWSWRFLKSLELWKMCNKMLQLTMNFALFFVFAAELYIFIEKKRVLLEQSSNYFNTCIKFVLLSKLSERCKRKILHIRQKGRHWHVLTSVDYPKTKTRISNSVGHKSAIQSTILRCWVGPRPGIFMY